MRYIEREDSIGYSKRNRYGCDCREIPIDPLERVHRAEAAEVAAVSGCIDCSPGSLIEVVGKGGWVDAMNGRRDWRCRKSERNVAVEGNDHMVVEKMRGNAIEIEVD